MQQNHQSVKEASPYNINAKESSPFLQTSPPVIKEASPFIPKSPPAMKEPSPFSLPTSSSFYGLSQKDRSQVQQMPSSVSLPVPLDSFAQNKNESQNNGDSLLLPTSPQ